MSLTGCGDGIQLGVVVMEGEVPGDCVAGSTSDGKL